jgi:hypothetical protein
MRATIYSIRVRNAAPAARCSRLRRLQGEAVAQTVVRDIGYGRDREPAPSKLLLRFLTVRWPPGTGCSCLFDRREPVAPNARGSRRVRLIKDDRTAAARASIPGGAERPCGRSPPSRCPTPCCDGIVRSRGSGRPAERPDGAACSPRFGELSSAWRMRIRRGGYTRDPRRAEGRGALIG